MASLAFLASLAVLVWWGVRCVKKGNDFHCHYEASQRFIERLDLYVPGAETGLTYVYPPLYAGLLTPLTLLNSKAAAAVWYVVKLGLTAWVFYVLWVWVAPGVPWTWKFAGLFFLSTGRFMIDDFQLGQVTLVVTELTILGLYLKVKGREGWGAVLLGLAIALKLIPGIFLVYFLFKKDWKFAGVMAASALGWTLFPAIWYGSSYTWLLGRFADQQLLGAAASSPISGADNQSLQGMLMRLLGKFPTEMNVWPYANVAEFSYASIKWMVLVGDLAVLGCFWWIVRRWSGWTGSMAAAFAVMLIISPNSGKSYLAALALPCAVVIGTLLTQPKSPEWKSVKHWYVASLVLCTLTADGWIGRSACDVASSYSVMFWGILVVLVSLMKGVKLNPLLV